MALVSIRHRTAYRYRKPVAFGEHRLMLQPLEGRDQRIVSFDLAIDPRPEALRHFSHVSGATLGVARFAVRSRSLTVESRVLVDHRPAAPFAEDEAPDQLIGLMPFLYAPELRPDLAPFLARAEHSAHDAVAEYAHRFVRPLGATDLREALSLMTQAMARDFRYGTRLSGHPQRPEETLARAGGSCRDFAVLMIDAARSLGLAARFVSGYVRTAPSTEVRGGGHTHAWTQVFLPADGWVDFDPTNGGIGAKNLIRVAAVRDPLQALPLHGVWFGDAGDSLGMQVDVQVDFDATRESVAVVQLPSRLRFAARG
ncbi:transglutaminase family protein [Phenylobacterium immobile]|uniref:transglutaminase family protein n=1 Tax=Phenylobacterium immobile TaxID=21 RepID=UPI000A76ED75|nr:transglutaminase family protein [Phenylobacterium immobile]